MTKPQLADVQITPVRLVGYARFSSDARDQDPQVQNLRAAGCDRIYQEYYAGVSGSPPILGRLLSELSSGDILVVDRLDRLARSTSHLLQLVDDLQVRGIQFRALQDPIDTSTSLGMFAVDILRAAARLDKAAIQERTKAGVQAAKARGTLLGNPQLRERRPDAIKALSKARERTYLSGLKSSAPDWLPTVQKMRPQHTWENVVLTLNMRGGDWTIERLRRAVHRLVRDGLGERELLARAPRRVSDDNLIQVVAAIVIADPNLSLRRIAAELDMMGHHPPRGGRIWHASSVRHLLDEAHRFGLIPR